MLLIGMNNNFMKYPTAPITAKPTAHEPAICKNSKKTLSSINSDKKRTFFVGLGASIDEESRVLDKVFSIIDDFFSVVLNLLGHFC